MVGNNLAGLTDEATAAETILGAGDLALLTAVRERASAEGVDLATCVTQTLQRYTVQASHEEWIALMGVLNRSSDPATTCLKRAFTYAARATSSA
jgi:hypothetical protein